jgi:hypothetical protein
MSGASYAIGRDLHGDWDLLSAYVDGELAAEERRAVEDHLAACPGCRAELDGMRRVASRLRSLERAAPPPLLADRVARRVAVAARQPGLVVRIEEALRRLPVESSTLMTFGVVVALTAIAALFVAGVEDSDRADRDRRPAAAAVRSAAPAGDDALRITTAVVHGRVFDRDGDVWRERHLGPGSGDGAPRIGADDPAALEMLEAEPRLRDLLTGSHGVLLDDGTGAVFWIVPRAGQ